MTRLSPAELSSAATLCALTAFAVCARAAALGDIEVRSSPGQPLDAVIAIDAPPDERLEAACIFLSHGPAESGPYVTRARVGIELRGVARYLRLLGADPVQDTSARLRVVVRCPGDTRLAYRQYTALFAPKGAPLAPIALPGAVRRVPGASAVLPAISTGFPVLPGDSLGSLASAMFPGDANARAAYLEALRAANPTLAALGTGESLTPGSALILPDLRAFALSRPARPAPAPHAAARAEPSPPVAPQTPRIRRQLAAAPTPALPPSSALTRTVEPSAAPAPRPAAPPAASARSSPFVLRLSSGEIDLSRTRGMDEKSRARLRERLLVLEVDDQVAAFLALRDSVRKLEGRVAELQLKLSSLPAPAAAPKAEVPATRIEPAPARGEPPPAPKSEPAPKAAASPKAEPPPKAEPAPKAQTPPKTEPASKAEPAPGPAAAVPRAPKAAIPKVVPAPAAPQDEGLPEWVWAGVVALAALALAIGWAFVRRRKAAAEVEPSTRQAATILLDDRPVVPDMEIESAPVVVAEPAPAKPAAARREIGSDAHLATEVRAGDPGALRRRYIEERFPEIANRAIVLDDPDSVVKGARLFYEDGALPRAVELLQFATEEKPEVTAPWLALFEIFRLERLTGEYSELARRFKDAHGRTQSWRKVQYFGRELDPDNPLYHDASLAIDTIRFEAGKPLAGERFDPVSENWLKAPMDFQNEVLANELRRTLMAEAGVAEQDLVPNPMPALRSVEMFTVA